MNERKEYHKRYYEENKNRIKEQVGVYKKENKEKIREQQKQYREENRDRIKKHKEQSKEQIAKYRKEYEERNKERIAKRRKEYDARNKDKKREYEKKRYKENKDKIRERYYRKSQVRLNHIMSVGIRRSLKSKNSSKNGRHWEDLVGYTLEDLKQHLENQFDENMNWDNQGTYWHIDHIVPKAAFQFDSPEDEEFQLCWCLDNLQPLEGMENIRKSNRLDYYIENPIGKAG